MIVVSHPRSGSSTFCRMLHYAINPQFKSGEGTRLAEFLNYGSNGDGNNNGWHFNTFPLIQHFVIDQSSEPLLYKLNVLDERVFDIEIGDDWHLAMAEFLQGRWKTPMIKQEICITKDNWRGLIAEQLKARIKYIDFLHNNGIPFTCKHFLRNGTTHFIDRASKYYRVGLLEPDPRPVTDPPLINFDYQRYDHVFLLATNPARSVMSGAILNNYKLKAKAHNFDTIDYEPLVPEPNPPEIRPVQLRNRLGAILALYHDLQQHPDSPVITNTQLFEDNAVTINGVTHKFDEYNQQDKGKEIPIPYANPIQDYHSNSREISKQVEEIVTTRYPDIVEKHGLKFE